MTAVSACSHTSEVNRMLDYSRAEIPQRVRPKHSEPHKLGQQIVIADVKRQSAELPLRDLHQNTPSDYLTTFNSGELKHSTN